MGNNDIVLGIKIKLDGREVDGEVRLLRDDLNRLSNATRDQGDSARSGASGNQQLRNSLRDTGAEARNTGRSLRQMARDTFDVSGALRGLVAGLSALALYRTAKEIIQTADDMTLLAGRLRVATSSARDYTQANRDLLQISLETHTALDANATLFARTNKAIEKLGGTSGDTARLVKTIAEGLKISGASQGEVNSVVRQFSQALASGVLRGDEFNSIMENGSRIAYALAESLGVDIGTLRKMAEAGELSSQRIIAALLSQSDTFDAEYKQIPLTVAAAFQDVKTQFASYIHTVDSGSGATHGLAGAVELLAVNLRPVLDTIVTLGKITLAVVAGQMVGAIGQYIATKTLAIQVEIAHAEALSLDLARTVQLTSASLALAQTNEAAAAATLAQTQAQIAQTQAQIAASVTISRHVLLTEQLNILLAQEAAETTALSSAQAALASAQTAAADAAAAQTAANATLRASFAALLSPMNLINAGLAIFVGWQFAGLLDQFESVRRAAHVVAGSIAHMINLAQYGFKAGRAVLSGQFDQLPSIKQQHYQLQQGITASVADSYLGNDKASTPFQGLDSGYKKFLQDQQAQSAKLEAQQQEATSKKALLDTDVALLKAKGQLRKAYELEAGAIKGLDAEGQKRYVQEKLEIDSLKSHGKASNHAASESKKFANAETSRREEITKTLEQIRQETALIGLSDKARQRSIELTHALTKAKGAEVDAIKSALQTKWDEIDADQRRNDMWAALVENANALDKLRDDAAEAKRIAALAKELQIQGLSNDKIKERIDLEKTLVAAREANPDLDQKQVDDYTKARLDAEKSLADIVDNGSKNSADFFEAAWKRAAENIQDSLANMFENLLNGDALNSFEDFFKNIQKSINRVFAEQLATSIQNMFKNSFTSGASGGSAGSSGAASAFGGLFSGAADWIKNQLGFGSAATAPGSSSNPATTPGLSSNSAFSGPPTINNSSSYFKGNGPLLSYQNPASSAGGFGQFFSTGSGGGFSLSGANGGGSGYAILGSLAKLIPGAGSYNLKGPQHNAQVEGIVAIENQVSDMIGNFFPLAKLFAPIKNFAYNLGAKLFPQYRQSLIGHFLGSAFGPLGHVFSGLLFGTKIPEPTSFTRGSYSNGKITVGKSQAFEGGDVSITRGFTRQFGDLITGLGHTLNQSFRDFTTNFGHKLDYRGDQQVMGGVRDKGGAYYLREFSKGTLQELASEAAIAVVKRNISNQDDLHYRQAIRDAKGLKGLENRIGKIDQIGVAIGEYGEALSKLREINQQFDEMAKNAKKYHFAESEVEATRQRAINALKNDTLTAFRQLAGLGPTLAAQLGDLNNQMIALEANARTLKLAEGDLLGLRAKAIAAAREQYLAPLTDVNASIVDQIAQLTGNLPAAEDVAPLYELLAASTDPTEQTRYIDRIQRALTQRYNVEIASINKVSGAVSNLKQFVDGLKLSNLSTLDPEQRLREAQGQYGTTLLKAQAGDQAALGNLANTAQAYLQEAQSYYASTPAYADIFSNVTDTLSNLGASLGGTTDAESAATEAANALADSLQSLKDLVDSIVTSQGSAFDAAVGGVSGGPAADASAGGISSGPTSPAATFQDLAENQMAANIDALPEDATKAARRAVNEQNRDLRAQINAWLFGGDDELAKTQSYQELTASIDETRAALKDVKKSDPQHDALRAELDGLLAQRKALGKVKFREQGGWTQGPTIVGENGPELIDFARPTHVQNNQRTQSIIAGSNDNVVAELQKANQELQALVRLQAAQAQAMLERLDSIAGSMTAVERKTRLGAAA